MKPEEFKCEECGGIFEKGWTDNEARLEQIENEFGNIPNNQLAVICDDCYKKIMRTKNT